MKKIILDTNFLMAVTQFKADIFSEIKRICNFKHDIFIIDKTIDELKKIVKLQKGKNKEAAKIALLIIKNKKIKKIKRNKDINVDRILLKQKDAIIATQDIELKRKLRKRGIRTISLRQRKYLVFN